eukprot:NODE_148_length_1339_cov_2101.957096_g144_i0.p1 GENE.NODE_148_length_1339_cov_2101.957096_g144_i0~~NODE_148_length_1339_cov_2101.957096_g144_i0.p1  ORF type:complete len:345 (+),score=134.08 NODE_148_length_1339_cov_2101.957096_g144_i0:61-1095(+)
MFGGTAGALDAADGVIDGKFFGRNIVQAGAPAMVQTTPMVSATPQIVGGGFTSFGGGVGSNAMALDAADGVIDGKFFGRNIVQAGGYSGGLTGGYTSGLTSFGSPQVIGGGLTTFGAGVGSNALSLDAADGRIDGKFFGRPIVQAGSPVVSTTPVVSASPQIISTTPAFTSGVSSAALSLDAADGVIDGRCFGRPIVQASQPAFIQQPQIIQAQPQIIQAQPQIIQAQPQIIQAQPQFVAGAAPVGSSALALDAADGRIDGRFFGRPIVQQQQVGVAAGNPALSLDAADGRIDGKFFGRPIVQAGGAQVARGPVGGAAAALDAQDGVMDGRFFGRPIVQAGRRK